MDTFTSSHSKNDRQITTLHDHTVGGSNPLQSSTAIVEILQSSSVLKDYIALKDEYETFYSIPIGRPEIQGGIRNITLTKQKSCLTSGCLGCLGILVPSVILLMVSVKACGGGSVDDATIIESNDEKDKQTLVITKSSPTDHLDESTIQYVEDQNTYHLDERSDVQQNSPNEQYSTNESSHPSKTTNKTDLTTKLPPKTELTDRPFHVQEESIDSYTPPKPRDLPVR